KGANVQIANSSAIVVERGGFLHVEPGANVTKGNRDSGIVFQSGKEEQSVNPWFAKRLLK
ncbi:MAG TPA: hypothetical protein VHS96_16035, partial [Bacteroidia bacterium]|nr:hypothetical protein [Bacteroidia bacterium]